MTLLLSYQRYVIALRWIDVSISDKTNPIVANFQRELEFTSRSLAVRHAKKLLRKEECWGAYVELSVTDRKDSHAPEGVWTVESVDITPAGMQGKWVHNYKGVHQEAPKRSYRDSAKFKAVSNVSYF